MYMSCKLTSVTVHPIVLFLLAVWQINGWSTNRITAGPVEWMGDPASCCSQLHPAGFSLLLRRGPPLQHLVCSEGPPLAGISACWFHRNICFGAHVNKIVSQAAQARGVLGAVPAPAPRRPGHHHSLCLGGQSTLAAPLAKPVRAGFWRCICALQI